MAEQTSRLAIVLDSTGAQRNAEGLSGALTRMSQAGQKASDSAGKVEKATEDEAKALSNLLDKIDPVNAALNRLDEQQQQLAKFQSKGFIDTDTFDTYSKKLEETRNKLTSFNDGMDKGSVSAGQYKNAIRQLPAQFTDIFTSLAGGMPLWLVFTQQGGQIADSFGGWGSLLDVIKTELLGMKSANDDASESLSESANGLAENVENGKNFLRFLTPARLAIGGTAGAMAVLGLAYYQGSQEQDEFAKSLALTGNIIGKTTGQLGDMARVVSAAAGSTVSDAASVLNQLVSAGKVSSSSLESAAETILNLNDAAGIATEELVSDFNAIAQDPVSAISKLNDKYHFLTLATYNQIKALQEQGREEEAAKVASDTFSAAMNKRASDIQDGLGYLESAWKAVGDSAKGAWDSMLNIGRETTVQDRIQAVQNKIEQLTNNSRPGAFGLGSIGDGGAQEKQLASLREELQNLKAEATAQDVLNGAISTYQQRQQQAIKTKQEADRSGQQYMNNSERRAKAIERESSFLKAGAITAEEYARRLSRINEMYSDPKAPKTKMPAAYSEDAATRLLDQLNQQYSTLQSQYATSEKIGASTQSLIQWEQQLSDLKTKKTLTADQKSLLANQEAITAQLQKNAALEKEISLRKDAEKLTSYRNDLSGGLRNDATELQNNLNSNTVMSQEQRRQQEISKIVSAYQQKQTTLTNQRTTGQISDNLYQQETQALQAALNERLAMQQSYYTQLDALNGNWEAGVNNGLQSYLNSIPTVYQTTTTAVTSILDSTQNAISSNLSAMLQGTESLSDGFKNMAMGMGQAVIEALTKMAAQWLVYEAVQLVVGKSAAAGAASSMIAQATAMSQIAAINAYASAAAIPITGWALAPVAMASAEAATVPLLASIAASSAAMTAGAGFEKGGYTGNMGTKSVAGVVHGQEYVFDAAATRKIGVSNLESIRKNGLDATLSRSGMGTGSDTAASTPSQNVFQFTGAPLTINGNPDDKTILMVQQAQRRGAIEGYQMMVNDIATGKGKGSKALATGWNTKRRAG